MFNDRLQATLTLVIGGDTFVLPAGAIERIDLAARTYAFDAEVVFWASSEGQTDDVFAPFNSTDIIKATLEIANGRLALAGEVPTVSTFVGYVTERSFEETTSDDIQGEPILERCYTVRFADPAQVFWRAHRPLALYADTSIKEVLDQHVAQGMTLNCEWPRLEQAQNIVCVGLGSACKASFYDFVVWLVSDLCGVIELCADTSTYRIAKEKAEAADPTDMDASSVSALRVEPPLVQRHATAVLNPFSEATVAKTDVANALAATGVRRDVVAHTPIASNVERRAQIEADRMRQRAHHLHVTFGELPPSFPVPGVMHTVGDGFSKRLFAAGKAYRSIALHVRAGPPEGERDESDLGDAGAVFGLDITAEFERDTDPVPVLPASEPPAYPVLAEGKVLSASGAETDRTWHAQESESNSVVRYRVQIPLWNQKVVAPFVPFGETGHFFFPAYKNQRVLVAFDFDSARIVSFLDWAGKLATDTQGNQIIMGKRDASSTVVKHIYSDGSPVLTVVRTMAGDMQTLELSEGRFFLEVKEEETDAPEEESYDLSPQAEVAKDGASAAARSGISDLAGDYESSMGAASSTLDAAGAEVEAGVGSAATALSGKVAAVETELSNKAADVSAAADALAAKVALAKAELEQALEDP